MLSMFIPHFCPSLQKEILFVRQTDGQYVKYRFNALLQKFKKFKCSDCHLETTEHDLQLISYQWSVEHGQYVIQAKNQLTGKVGAFVYQDPNGFVEVTLKEALLNPEKLSGAPNEILFTVGGFNGCPVTNITKGSRGFLRRQRFNEETQRFEPIPAASVKLLGQEGIQKTKKIQNPGKIKKNEKIEKINKGDGDICNLERWLSQCVLMKPKNSKEAEDERDRQLEALLRSRDIEYARFPSKTNRSIIKNSQNPAKPTLPYNYPDDEQIYEEFQGKEDDSNASGASAASQGSRTPENGSETAKKREIRSGDVSIIRKIARIMGKSKDSQKIDETIVYEENIYEMGASERTV